MTNVKPVKLRNFEIGANKLTILAGPCAIENRDILFTIAEAMKKTNTRTRYQLCF